MELPRCLHHRAVRAGRGGIVTRAARVIHLGGAVAVVPNRLARPKGIVHFLGGAFVSATPHLVYPLLLERLADGGYTVVATPYAVTFQHLQCAREVHAAFNSALAELQSTCAWVAPAGAAVHGVGHSNGALLHMLIAAQGLAGRGTSSSASSSKPSSTTSIGGSAGGGAGLSSGGGANVLISYNHLQVADAVPVPLGLLAPAVQAARGDNRLVQLAQQGLQQAASTAQQLLGLSPAAAGPAWQQQQRRQEELLGSSLSQLQQWDPALLQLGSVLDEVGDGWQEFAPPPSEARQLIAARYDVPHTLLVQFVDDSIDQSPQAEAMLASISSSSSGSSSSVSSSLDGLPQRCVVRQVLPGSHVTPCGGGAPPRPPPGAPFTPADALAMAAMAALQADTQRLADRVLDFLDKHS